MRAICLKGMDTPVDDGERKFMSTAHPNRFDFAWMEIADICALHIRDTQADCCLRFGAENGRAFRFTSVKEASEHRTFSRRYWCIGFDSTRVSGHSQSVLKAYGPNGVAEAKQSGRGGSLWPGPIILRGRLTERGNPASGADGA